MKNTTNNNMFLPKAVAKTASCIRTSLLSLSPIHNHRLHHYPLQNPIFNFSTSSQKYQTKVKNLSDPISLQENGISSSATDAIRSPNLVALEYAGLNLPPLCEEVGHIRIRQHYLALSVPAVVPDWNDVFRDASLPLMLAKRANIWAKELSLSNAHFMFANATISFQQLVSSYSGPLVLVSVLCPDPHFKKKWHHKRRVLQKPLVDSIVDNLTSGGQVFVQLVHEVAVDIRNQFDIVSDMLQIDAIDPNFCCDPDGWLLNNPMGIRTEGEIHAELEGTLDQNGIIFLANSPAHIAASLITRPQMANVIWNVGEYCKSAMASPL